jgi:hypothetical protein
VLGAGVKSNALGINWFCHEKAFCDPDHIYGALHKSGTGATLGWRLGGGGLHLTVLQLRLPNLLDRVVGVTTELGWCSSPALNGGKSGLSASYAVPEQQTE